MLLPFDFEGRLLAVKVSLKTGYGLFKRLYEYGISFPFVIKGSDTELVKLINVTSPK